MKREREGEGRDKGKVEKEMVEARRPEMYIHVNVNW